MNKLFKNKRVVMTISLIVGVIMLSVPTFAEMNSKTGYDKMKDSLKITADNIYSKVNSYTGEMSMTLKDNEKVILTSTTKTKVDNIKKAKENSDSSNIGGKISKSSSYRDPKQNIYENSDGTYNVTEYSEGTNSNTSDINPFEQKNASDIEKIIDAAVLGLSDNVVVEEKADGSKAFSGSISENQVPTLINTVSSYFFKTSFVENLYQREQSGLPALTNDIYIKGVTGNASANKDGVLESIFATFTLTGKEENGTSHDITFEILVDITDINKTTVKTPDLTGKNIQKNVVYGDINVADGSMFVGDYKSDIVIRDNGKFVKIGERRVAISHGDSKNIEGRYYEEYLDGYAKSRAPIVFAFNANVQENGKGSGEFKITNADGKTEGGHIYLDARTGDINFWAESVQRNAPESYNGIFNRVFIK